MSPLKDRLTDRSSCVAIWIGEIASEGTLDEYIRFKFPHDFEVQPPPNNQPEFFVSSERKPVREILDGFSECRFFLDAAARCADLKKIGAAQCALVYYYVFFEEKDFVAPTGAPLLFLGNFSW